MAAYLRSEADDKILLEDGSGALLLDGAEIVYWNASIGHEAGRIYVDSWQMGYRENPAKLRW